MTPSAPSGRLLSIRSVGMCSSVGLDAASSCAAIRARVSRTEETWFHDREGNPIMAAVALEAVQGRQGHRRLTPLIEGAVRDCVAGGMAILKGKGRVPFLIALDGPGRIDHPEDLKDLLKGELSKLWESSALKEPEFLLGSLGFLHALRRARELLQTKDVDACLVVAADSMVNGRALRFLEESDRLKTDENSDGIIPGEAAAAVLVERPTASGFALADVCSVGLAEEPSVKSKTPNLARGMADAIRAALDQAGMALAEVDFRVGGMTGEAALFDEGATAIARVQRVHKESFELWVPAEKLGDVGAALPACMLVVAVVGISKGYAPGRSAILFMSSPSAERGACVVAAAAGRSDGR